MFREAGRAGGKWGRKLMGRVADRRKLEVSVFPPCPHQCPKSPNPLLFSSPLHPWSGARRVDATGPVVWRRGRERS